MTAADVGVLGATGRVGGATLAALSDLGVDAVPLIRDGARAGALRCGAERARVADLDDEAGLVRALDGVERLLLCSGHGPRMEDQQMRAVRAATAAGVKRVVKISASPASVFPGTPAEAAAAHLNVEEALRVSPVQAVCVRPNAFMQFLASLKPQIDAGQIALPLGDAAVSWIDAEDVGRTAAQLLLATDGDAVVEVTGPEALPLARVCEVISSVTGRPLRYEPVSGERALTVMVDRGADPWLAEHVVGIFRLFQERDAASVTDTVERITGAPARSLRTFAEEHFVYNVQS